MNHRIGWSLAIAGLFMGAWLDPWSLGQVDASALLGSARMAARQGQAVVLAMAFLQLTVGDLVAAATRAGALRVPAAVTGAGALVYVSGYALAVVWPGAPWLVVAGALLNLAGLLAMLGVGWAERGRDVTALILGVFAFGMLLDAASGVLAAEGGRFRPPFLGPDDGVRLRMLRLARAAAIALPVLVHLARSLPGAGRWSVASLAAGAAGMPAILVAASLTSVEVKYLLPLPALATFAGTVAAARLAGRGEASPVERAGWWLTSASMGVGLLMGLYAFDGPLPTPAWVGPYLAFPRRLSRLAHAYAIVFGVLAICLGRQTPHRADSPWPTVGEGLVVVGGAATLLVIGLAAVWPVLVPALSAGPALVTAGTILTLGRSPKGTAA